MRFSRWTRVYINITIENFQNQRLLIVKTKENGLNTLLQYTGIKRPKLGLLTNQTQTHIIFWVDVIVSRCFLFLCMSSLKNTSITQIKHFSLHFTYSAIFRYSWTHWIVYMACWFSNTLSVILFCSQVHCSYFYQQHTCCHFDTESIQLRIRI